MLHTVNKSPFSADSLSLCLEYAREGDVVLLLEDGVYAAMKGSNSEALMQSALANNTVVAIGPDLKTRGIVAEKMIQGIQIVGYDGFVDLVANNDKVQSWL